MTAHQRLTPRRPVPARYAAGGVPHYWVVDLKKRVTRVMADPDGDDYRTKAVVPFNSALAVPGSDRSVTLR